MLVESHTDQSINTEPHAYAVGIGVVRGNEGFSDAYTDPD